MFTEIDHPTATYHTTAINESGLKGESYLLSGERFTVSSPTKNEPGTNPEQLIGLALATCLNATIEAIETRKRYPHQSKVRVDVYQTPDGTALQFLIDVTVYIPTEIMGSKTAEAIFRLAESRCPVAKLLGKNEGVSFRRVEVWDAE